jgi:dihydroflavonol-4-reductase
MSRLWAVTGATGLLGNNLVRALVARGERVRVLVRGGATRPELAGIPLTIADGSLDSPLERCFDGADVVVHAAAQVRIGRRDADHMHRVNVDGTRAVCAAVERCGARLVHVSSVDGLGLRSLAHPADEMVSPRREEEVAPYITTKRAADAVVRASATDHVIVHPTFMLGPYDWKPSSGTMLRAIARGRGRIAPPGANNFVHVQDVVHGIIAAADGPRGRAWILGNENLTYREAWSLFARVTGGPAPVATLPPTAVAPVAAALDLAWTVVGWLGVPEGDLNGPAVRMGSKPHVFDPSRARAELGLPATPIEQAARDAWDWMRRDPRGATFSGTASPA